METGISIHAPREGSDTATDELLSLLIISIHAPREGSDRPGFFLFAAFLHFYPRSPRGERPTGKRRLSSAMRYFYPRSPRGERHPMIQVVPSGGSFLSTLPARGATGGLAGLPCSTHDFYPRSPRGERQATNEYISKNGLFLSTLPARGATPTPPPAR